jgi:hypothetical protein
MVLIQLLLPTRYSIGATVKDAAADLVDTRRELAETFDGVTAYVRSPAKGMWTAPDGHTEQDEVVMVEVVTDRFDGPWWRGYVSTLATRFRQDRIHVRAMQIQLVDDAG